jgi:hypothetical protein
MVKRLAPTSRFYGGLGCPDVSAVPFKLIITPDGAVAVTVTEVVAVGTISV